MILHVVPNQHLQNAEHFQFHSDVLKLVSETTPSALKSEEQCAAYAAVFASEGEIMRRIAESAITKQVGMGDIARDRIFRGLMALHKANLNHFDDKVRAAAARVDPVFRNFSDMAGKALAMQCAETHSMIKELKERHADDCIVLGLGQWLNELDMQNRAVQELMHNRYEETAAQSKLVLREVRLQVDAAYKTLTKRVDALQLIEGEAEGAPYADFIATLNAIVDRAALIIAQRRGRAASSTAKPRKSIED